MKKMQFTKKIGKRVLIVVMIFFVIWIAVPLIGIPILINRHINYRGYADKKYPMQDIYTADEFGLTSNEMYVTTEDGYQIWCDEIKVDQPKGVIIYLSGIDQPSVTYFYGHSKMMRELGYASFLLEVRSHGKSEGKKIGFGHDETKDVKAVIDYIKSQEEYGDIPIIAQGVSMGGACVLNAFGQLEEIDGVIAMSAFSSVQDVILDLEKEKHVPYFLRWIHKPFIKIALNWCYGSKKVEEIQPIKQIKNANGRPILLIACTGDRGGVPYVSTKRLAKVAPEAEVFIRDSWEHFIVKDCDYIKVSEDSEYCERITNFISRVTEEND